MIGDAALRRARAPSSDECPWIIGLVLGVAGGFVGLLFYAGSIPSFVLLVVSALLGQVSFVYCEVWERSLPIG